MMKKKTLFGRSFQYHRDYLPRSVFKFKQRWIGHFDDSLGSFLAPGHGTRNLDFPIGVIAIALPVATPECRANTGHFVNGLDDLCVLQVVSEAVPLAIDI